MVAEKKNILKVIDKYDEVDENLRKHDPNYPTADYLCSVTFEGLGAYSCPIRTVIPADSGQCSC